MPAVVPDYGKGTQAALRAARAGTVDLFKAPRYTAYTATIGQIGSWLPLGRIAAGSYKNDFSRKFYDLATGVPSTVKESFVTGVEGKLEFDLIEPTALAYELANGGQAGIPMFIGSPVATTAVTGTLAVDQFTVDAGDGALFAEGDEIEVNLSTGKEYTFITNIATDTLDVYPKLSAAPANTNAVKRVDGWEEGMGGSVVTRVALMAVFHAQDGHQIVTWVREARSEGVKDDFADGQKEMKVPVAFNAFGYTDASFTGPIVAKKYLLTPAMALDYPA